MNVLFLTIGRMECIESHSLYPDLLRQFRDNGHDVYVVSPYEKRIGKETVYIEENGVHMLHVKIGNLTKCNIIEKGVSTMMVGLQFKRAIKTYFRDIKFDIVLYSTPPITLAGVVKYIKRRDEASTYLLLKDIFPQNAVDIGLMSKSGVKGLLYRHFRCKEELLYALSDRIGCMSQANVDYILKHNREISTDKVEICPNCIDIQDVNLTVQERNEMREKYDIPQDKKVFIYGGNLGKPQDVPFIVQCLKACSDIKEVYFVIAGSGTDRHIIEEYVEKERPNHVKLFGQIPKDEYDKMIACCDVGLIFLDHRFTIPNFPSRLLSYMQAGLPVLACTDPNTDIGKVVVNGGFGWWCESNDVGAFREQIKLIVSINKATMQQRGKEYLHEHYTSEKAYRTIVQSLQR